MGMFWITEQCPPGKFSILLIWIRHCASSTDGEIKVRREMQSQPRLGGSDAHDFVPTIPGCIFGLYWPTPGPGGRILLSLLYSWQKERLKVPDWHSAQN